MKLKPHSIKKINTPGADNILKSGDTKKAAFGNKLNKSRPGLAKKILVADDDPAIVDVLTLMLEAAGYKVYPSANGETIPDVSETHPDLVLLDVLMSGINGEDICRELKDQPSTKHIPIILISANKDIGKISLSGCADDFLTKPFEMDNLLRVVAKHLK